jgi:hypothetical protein
VTTNWFDHYASSAIPDDLDVPPAADDKTPVEDASPSEPEPEGTTARRMRWHAHSGGSPIPPWMIKTLVVVALAVVSVGIYTAIQHDSPTNAVATPPPAPPSPSAVAVSTTSPPTTSQSASTSPTPPQRCPDQPKAAPTTPQGAVVAFQKAYFAGNTAELIKVIDPASYLATVDWPTLTGDVVGSDFCVKISTVENNVVEANTTVRTPKGEELLFIQSIRTIKEGKTYKISSIEDKPAPTET